MGKRHRTISGEKDLHKEDWRSWETVVFVFIVQFCIGVIGTMFSVLYVYITEYFESDKATTAWIGSIHRGTTWTLGESHVLVESQC